MGVILTSTLLYVGYLILMTNPWVPTATRTHGDVLPVHRREVTDAAEHKYSGEIVTVNNPVCRTIILHDFLSCVD